MSVWSDRYYEISYATRRGLVLPAEKKLCEKCGNPAVHRHHPDYSKPYEVIYLCVPCHRKTHKELGHIVGRPNLGKTVDMKQYNRDYYRKNRLKLLKRANDRHAEKRLKKILQ